MFSFNPKNVRRISEREKEETMIHQTRRTIVVHSFVKSSSHSYLTFSFHPKKPKNRHEKRSKPHPKLPNRHPYLTELKEIEDPISALEFFHQTIRSGFKPDYPIYSALIYKLARSRHFETVEELLHLIKDQNLHCRQTLFIALIQHYAKAGLPAKSTHLFLELPSFNCTRTLQLFNTLLDSLVDADCFSDAIAMFHRSSKMGLRPNSVSFNIIIKGHCKKDNWSEACHMFDEMLKREVSPSVVTYNILIGFLTKKGDMDEAMDLFKDMSVKGKKPNPVTYALLMGGFCSIGKYDVAKKMMFDMEYRGCKPGLVNFGVLMSDLGKRGKLEEARHLLAEMKRRRYRPDVVTYNILINYLCVLGRTQEAYKVLVEMQVDGCEPNAATYRMMVDGFCGAGEFDRATRILMAMLASKHCPRGETFDSLVVGLSDCGNVSDASMVLEEMEKRKIGLSLDGWGGLLRNVCDGDGGGFGLVAELVVDKNLFLQL